MCVWALMGIFASPGLPRPFQLHSGRNSRLNTRSIASTSRPFGSSPSIFLFSQFVRLLCSFSCSSLATGSNSNGGSPASAPAAFSPSATASFTCSSVASVVPSFFSTRSTRIETSSTSFWMWSILRCSCPI
uniref:Uncharacterized protein n=1 Tax=Anopheles merus TaxID=30066 RepID=A0A182UNR0_ANOME